MIDEKIYVPPLKIQGIKTKIVPLIKQNVNLNENTLWVEPFMGSGVVGFNLAPENAIFGDTNPHIIDFYLGIQNNTITPQIVRYFLEDEGQKLAKYDNEYYIEVRDRFNEKKDPLDFLFLNRSCFNGMMRFNKKNEFNVPYGHKPERFSKAYITKIVNQVAHVQEKIHNNNWQFVCSPFFETIGCANANSFIYCDPPYIGRHTDYYDSWDESDEYLLCEKLKESGARFMLSTWDHTEFRRNQYIDTLWSFCDKITREHFYHVGAKESNRNPVVEALLVNYTPSKRPIRVIQTNEQLSMFS